MYATHWDPDLFAGTSLGGSTYGGGNNVPTIFEGELPGEWEYGDPQAGGGGGGWLDFLKDVGTSALDSWLRGPMQPSSSSGGGVAPSPSTSGMEPGGMTLYYPTGGGAPSSGGLGSAAPLLLVLVAVVVAAVYFTR